MNRFRPDFKRKFEDMFDDDTMTQYIYHCNAQTPRYIDACHIITFLTTEHNALQKADTLSIPRALFFHYSTNFHCTFSICFPFSSGEVGFRAMSESLGWAKRPMLQRVHLLPPSMPLTMLYGAQSWVDSSSGDRVVQIRSQVHSKVLVSRHAKM